MKPSPSILSNAIKMGAAEKSIDLDPNKMVFIHAALSWETLSVRTEAMLNKRRLQNSLGIKLNGRESKKIIGHYTRDRFGFSWSDATHKKGERHLGFATVVAKYTNHGFGEPAPRLFLLATPGGQVWICLLNSDNAVLIDEVLHPKVFFKSWEEKVKASLTKDGDFFDELKVCIIENQGPPPGGYCVTFPPSQKAITEEEATNLTANIGAIINEKMLGVNVMVVASTQIWPLLKDMDILPIRPTIYQGYKGFREKIREIYLEWVDRWV